jgi:hypothetical protein
MIIALLLFAIGLILAPAAYGVTAEKLSKGRDPWLSILMLTGLAVTGATMNFAGGVSAKAAAWTVFAAIVVYILLRLLFGRGSAFEVFFAIHFAAFLFWILWPQLERAKLKQQRLQQQELNSHR